jgi:hypothetical protein
MGKKFAGRVVQGVEQYGTLWRFVLTMPVTEIVFRYNVECLSIVSTIIPLLSVRLLSNEEESQITSVKHARLDKHIHLDAIPILFREKPVTRIEHHISLISDVAECLVAIFL